MDYKILRQKESGHTLIEYKGVIYNWYARYGDKVSYEISTEELTDYYYLTPLQCVLEVGAARVKFRYIKKVVELLRRMKIYGL